MQVNLILSDHSVEFRRELAYLSEDTKLLAILAKDSEEEVCLAVAENTSTPKKILHDLAKNPNSSIEILMAVAENENTGLDTLKYLSKHEDDAVRESVAINPNLNQEILETLANDPNFEVVLLVASHPLASTELLDMILAQNDESTIFEALADNPNTSSGTLEILFDEGYNKFNHESISKFIAQNKNAAPELLIDILAEYPDFAELILLHPNVNMEIINRLMTNDDYGTREAARKAKKRKKEEMAKEKN